MCIRGSSWVGTAENTVPLTAEAVAELAKGSTLERLSLFAGAMGGAGCGALADAVRRGAWPRLQQLDLGGCELSQDAVSELFLALEVGAMPKLQVRSLSSCPWLKVGVQAVWGPSIQLREL